VYCQAAHVGDGLETGKRAVKSIGVHVRAATAVAELPLKLSLSEG
jgi:hypothetical protein